MSDVPSDESRPSPTPCDVAELQKCLQEHKGDRIKVHVGVCCPQINVHFVALSVCTVHQFL